MSIASTAASINPNARSKKMPAMVMIPQSPIGASSIALKFSNIHTPIMKNNGLAIVVMNLSTGQVKIRPKNKRKPTATQLEPNAAAEALNLGPPGCAV